jgi:uncharacterized protein YciI
MANWFLVLRPFVVEPEEWQPTLDEHLNWIKEQHDSGVILFSGPKADYSMGIYLVRAASREAAESIAASDPFTKKGQSTFELIEWEIHQAFGIGPFKASEFD